MMHLSIFAPQEVRTLQVGRNWHEQASDFVHYDLPKVAFILIFGFILQRITLFFVRRMRRMADRQVGNSQRASQLRTMSSVLRATAYTAIGIYVLLQILPIFDIDLKPLLASVGVVGLGISFGAQSIFKDMLNGIFILLEDQFNIGDSVKMAGLTGTVEDMSLRCTILRDGDGTQNIIPNSQITTVQNLSRDYSVASLHVSVDASENPDKVMELLGQLAMEVRKDAAFAQVTIEDPKVLGVDKINGSEVMYLVNTKVRANQKDGVLRELRRRILLGFEKNQIRLGIPSSAVIVNAQDPTLPSAPATVLGGGD
jgi:small conductance mechanosensitive channel